MTTPEMHVWFRQYAQRMGLQNVRAILPEEIDVLINTSIVDVVNQLIRENLGVINDRIVTDNSKIGQINALRTLYKVVELPITKFVEVPSVTKQYELTLNADTYSPYWALYDLGSAYTTKLLVYIDSSNNIWIPFDEQEMLALFQDDEESFIAKPISNVSDISSISTNYLQFDTNVVYTQDKIYNISDLGEALAEGKITDVIRTVEDYRFGLALCCTDEDDNPYIHSSVRDKTDVSAVKIMLQNFAGSSDTAGKYIKKLEVVQYTPAIYVDEDNKQNGYLCINVTYNGPFNFWISDCNVAESAEEGIWWEPSPIAETWDDVKLHRLFEFTEDSPYTGLLKGKNIIDNFFYLVDFAINYKKAENGYNLDDIKEITYTSGSDAFVTNYFPVRHIDDVYLADTLNDFVSKPSLRSPIIVIYGDTYDVYVDKFVKLAGRDGKDYFLANKLMPYNIRVSYIAKPAVVKYSEDLSGNNVDCDLPESLHVDILKHAVDLYRTSISNNLYGAQQQDRAQQQELARNVARPTNDGYQN